MPRGRPGRPKNVRRPYKPNKSASDSGDAESLSALRGRLRSSRDAPPAGASAAPSTTERESSAAPREGSHSERPPGTSSPVEVPDPSVDFELTLPSALMDSHEDGSWDPAGDVGAVAAGGSGPPVVAGGSGPPVDAGGSLPPPAPSSASRPASPAGCMGCPSCCSSWDAACAVRAHWLTLPSAPPSAPPLAPPLLVPLASAAESPGTRAARQIADQQRELRILADLERAVKASRDVEAESHKQLLAERAKEQAAIDKRLADSKRQLDANDEAIRNTVSWNKKLEKDRTDLQAKLADDLRKADAERQRLSVERNRLETAVNSLRTDHSAWTADCKRIQEQRAGEVDILDRERKLAQHEMELRRARLMDIQAEVDAVDAVAT